MDIVDRFGVTGISGLIGTGRLAEHQAACETYDTCPYHTGTSNQPPFNASNFSVSASSAVRNSAIAASISAAVFS